MSSITKTNTFVPATSARADQVMQNFQELEDFLNNNVQDEMASKAYTGLPSLPASDPSAHTHAVRKTFADLHPKLQAAQSDLSGTVGTTGTVWHFGRKFLKVAGDGSVTISWPTFGSYLIAVYPTGAGTTNDHPMASYTLSSCKWFISGTPNAFLVVQYLAVGK